MQQGEVYKESIELIHQAFSEGDEALRHVLSGYHPSEIAILFKHLSKEERERIINLLPAELASDAISEMDEEQHPGKLLLQVEPEKRKEIVEELDYDDATDILSQLDDSEQQEILDNVDEENANSIRNLLNYDEDTAGGIMNSRYISVNIHLSKKQAIDEIIRQSEDIEEFYSINVVDDENRLKGIVSLKNIIKSRADITIEELLNTNFIYVKTDTDQEEVARLMSQYNLVSIPVTDYADHLLGQITVDDIMDVLEDESTEDILKIAGVSEGEELSGSWKEAIKSRLPWLVLNLGTAFLAASVIRYYDATIAELAILAGYMTIIAGMGGNAATQALAVTIRRISLSQLSNRQARNTIVKEMLVGLTNGAINGLLVVIVAILFDSNPMLGLVIFLAMTGNLVIAGVTGAAVPLLLKKVGIDPAVASSIIISTFTDVFGFLLPLALASKLLL